MHRVRQQNPDKNCNFSELTIYTAVWVKKKLCHPNHGYNSVNSWSICKILSLQISVIICRYLQLNYRYLQMFADICKQKLNV